VKHVDYLLSLPARLLVRACHDLLGQKKGYPLAKWLWTRWLVLNLQLRMRLRRRGWLRTEARLALEHFGHWIDPPIVQTFKLSDDRMINVSWRLEVARSPLMKLTPADRTSRRPTHP
jgi:hypothetical protein